MADETSKDESDGKQPAGPEPERVKIDKPWEKAMEEALKKKRPPKGWPDHDEGKKKPKK